MINMINNSPTLFLIIINVLCSQHTGCKSQNDATNLNIITKQKFIFYK